MITVQNIEEIYSMVWSGQSLPEGVSSSDIDNLKIYSASRPDLENWLLNSNLQESVCASPEDIESRKQKGFVWFKGFAKMLKEDSENIEDYNEFDEGPKLRVSNDNYIVYDYENEEETLLYKFTDDINNEEYEDYNVDWNDPCLIGYIFGYCSAGYVHLLGEDGNPVKKICDGHHFENNAPIVIIPKSDWDRENWCIKEDALSKYPQINKTE